MTSAQAALRRAAAVSGWPPACQVEVRWKARRKVDEVALAGDAAVADPLGEVGAEAGAVDPADRVARSDAVPLAMARDHDGVVVVGAAAGPDSEAALGEADWADAAEAAVAAAANDRAGRTDS